MAALLAFRDTGDYGSEAMALLNFAGAPHGGRLRLLHPENESEPRITPRVLIYHSIVGSAEGAYRMFRDSSNLESHFIVDLDGEIWQLVDTGRQADANYRANDFAVSVETADRGHPDVEEWTRQQIDSLVWLAWECHRLHGIPLRRVDRWDGSGIGYHTIWGAPSNWTPVQKSCPGRARIAQFPGLLERIKAGGQQGDLSMADADSIMDALADLRRDLTVFGTTGLEATVEAFASRQRDALAKLDAALNQVGALAVRVDALATGAAAAPVTLTDTQLAQVVAELRSGLAQPVGAHLAALMANGLRAGADQLTQSGGLA